MQLLKCRYVSSLPVDILSVGLKHCVLFIIIILLSEDSSNSGRLSSYYDSSSAEPWCDRTVLTI